MRKFSSYGPIDTDQHYYVARQELIDSAVQHLVGEDPEKGGHYITVWAPRQRGKSWIMQQTLWRLQNDPQYAGFDVLKINLEHLKMTPDIIRVVQVITDEISAKLALDPIAIRQVDDFYAIFRQGTLKKPLLLILDEFDALAAEAISGIIGVFRNIYNTRRDQQNKNTEAKEYLLHGVALIGVRGVLGLENQRGSPFNVQRSLHIPNLTQAEVEQMFHWYEQESGQQVEPTVIARLYAELRGQPGLTSWLGELLTETYNERRPTITMDDFEIAYAAASSLLPNANILNLINKAKDEPQRSFVIDLFQSDGKIEFTYDDPVINFLYMNGVIDEEVVDKRQYYVKFPCPFVQKRLFNHFAREIFRETGQLYPPFTDLTDVFTANGLGVTSMLRHYERYLQQNHTWLFKEAPRRVDLRLYEAVYHFNLFMWLSRFLQRPGGRIFPEFPTGNGREPSGRDLLIRYQGQVYGLELKSFSNDFEYRASLQQAARYAHQLQLTTIAVVFFVEAVDDANRTKYEAPYNDPQRGVVVQPIFITTVE